MTVIKLKYAIQHFEDGTVSFNASLKNDSGEVIGTEKSNTIEISKDYNEILKPVNFEISLQNVTSLLIPHCNLSYLPNELHFCNLIDLDISNNCFSHVPDFVIYHNANLQNINLSYNRIGKFNTEPKCYKKLKYLNLGNNKLLDVPQWIFNSSCTALETLDLSDNPLKHTSISFLLGGSLIKLCSLSLNNCNINCCFKFIQEVPHLTNLSISNINKDYLNTIQELPFKEIMSVSTLVELNFSGLGCACLSEEISELCALEILNISYNHLSWLPNNLTKLKMLRILNVSNNELLSLPLSIDELEKLTELDLSFNLIGSLPESLANLKELKLLDCYNNDLIEDAFLVVNKMPSLVAFDIEQNAFYTSGDQRYFEMRSNIWKNRGGRMEGNKLIDVSEDEDERSYFSSSDGRESVDLEETYINTIDHEEENWDCDTDSIGDDSLLVLPPYKFKLIRKPVPYNPIDHINAACFEDALEDNT